MSLLFGIERGREDFNFKAYHFIARWKSIDTRSLVCDHLEEENAS